MIGRHSFSQDYLVVLEAAPAEAVKSLLARLLVADAVSFSNGVATYEPA